MRVSYIRGVQHY